MGLFVLAGLATLASLGPQHTNYFPPAFAQPTLNCSSGRPGKPIPIVSNFENRWYSSHLAAAKEPSLFVASTRRASSARESLRFTWLRSFHPPVIIRIEGLGSPRPYLVTKQLSGAGGYDPGSIAKSVERSLSAKEARAMKATLTKANVVGMSPKACELGLDGAVWLIEGVDARGYHFVERWSPDAGGVHDVGLMMLRLTGWKHDPIY